MKKLFLNLLATALACGATRGATGVALKQVTQLAVNETRTGIEEGTLASPVRTNIYSLRAFGAFGDAKWVNHLKANTNSTTITTDMGQFTAADVGDHIGIIGGGTNRQTFWTVITKVIDHNTIQVSDSVVMAYTNVFADAKIQPFTLGFPAHYGAHDDTAAIQAWLDQVTNILSAACQWKAEAGNYLMLSNVSFPNFAQVVIPDPFRNVSPMNWPRNFEPTMEIFGESRGEPWFGNENGELRPPPSATVFISNLQGGNGVAQCGTNLIGNVVFGTRLYDHRSGVTAAVTPNPLGCYWPLNLIQLKMRDFTVFMGYDANAVGIDLLGASGEPQCKNLNIIGGGFNNCMCPEFTGTNGWAIILPGCYSGSAGTFNNMITWGFKNHADLGLGQGNYWTMGVGDNGFTSVFAGGAAIQDFDNCQFTGISHWLAGSGLGYYVNRSSSPQITVMIFQSQINPSTVPNWQTNIWAIYDPSNFLCNGGIASRAGNIWYDNLNQSNDNQPQVFQGKAHMKGVLPINLYPHPSFHGTNYDYNPMVHNGSQIFTNLVSHQGPETFTGPVNFDGAGIVNLNGYWYGQEGDFGTYAGIATGGDDSLLFSLAGNGKGGRFGAFSFGLIDTLFDPYPVADFGFNSQFSGENTAYGFMGSGYTFVVTTNGDAHVYGSLLASNSVQAASFAGVSGPATFYGNSALTNVVISGPTNATPPADTTTPKAWANFTNANGGVFKIPLYQ